MALGFKFLLRELELVSIRVRDVIVGPITLKVTLTLTSSKTDPTARSCKRSWVCTRKNNYEDDWKTCAVHVTMSILEAIDADNRYGDEFLFGTSAGNAVSMGDMVASF